MKDIITGGVYAVDLHGTEAYEFKGVHPAMIVRLLKEEKMYYVVPLTTYTKERWERCKRKGFGTRIISTNSIARIDKLNIVSEKQVQSRYYNGGHIVVPTQKEVETALRRVEEYICLSNGKTNREYNKFIIQRENFEKDIKILLMDKKFDEFLYPVVIDHDISFEYPCGKLSFIGSADIKDIISKMINYTDMIISKKGSNMEISLKVEKENFLTFKEKYDKLKTQKGNSDM